MLQLKKNWQKRLRKGQKKKGLWHNRKRKYCLQVIKI